MEADGDKMGLIGWEEVGGFSTTLLHRLCTEHLQQTGRY